MEIKAGSAIFLDTNILIYSSIPQSPFHALASNTVNQLERKGFPLWISRQLFREFLATLTRPNLFPEPIPMSQIISQIKYFEDRFFLAEDGLVVTQRLLTLMETIPIGGKQVHDANIVATMQAYQIECLLTENVDDFKRFSGMITVIPLGANL